MKRVLTPFLLQCYSPAIAIVLISSIGFIVPWSAIPGRIALGVTLFLTMANIFYDNRVIQNLKNYDYAVYVSKALLVIIE